MAPVVHAAAAAASTASKPLLHVLRLHRRLGIFAQLRLEEALLRCDTRSWLVLNAGVDNTPAIVVGASGDVDSLVNLSAARQATPRPTLVRRFSGGGTVFVDGGTLLVSLVSSAAAVRGRPLFPRDVMAWTAAAMYAPALAALAVPNFALREHDYVLGEHKFGGNAQSLSRERWVHHTSLLWTADAVRMRSLLHLPARRPTYRGDRTHADFLATLREHVPQERAAAAASEAEATGLSQVLAHSHGWHEGAAALFPALLRALSNEFTLIDTPLEDALAVAALPQERVGTHELSLDSEAHAVQTAST